MGEPYFSFNTFLKQKFPETKIRKIPINAGFCCPNKNGPISTKGCIFCDAYGSGPIHTGGPTIQKQIENFIGSHSGVKYIAYYQANTNTIGSVEELREKFEIIYQYPEIIGLFIGTRPDSIGEDIYPLLRELNQQTYLNIELGLQSIHEKSLIWLNRNHTYSQFLETYDKLKRSGISIVVHLIVGIPGESKSEMMGTIDEMTRLKPEGIKIHLLHVLKGTRLERLYKQGKLSLMSQEEYIETVIDMLERLSPEIVIHRLTGERDESLFVAPSWALDKHHTIDSIRKRMKERDTRQGKRQI